MERYIDPAYKPEESLLLRYHKAISFEKLSKADFEAVTLNEGARILKLLDYKGVHVYLADESTLMSAGTFKGLEACFITALCKKRQYDKVVFSSGANLGSALTLYGQKAGMETFFFHPESTSWKLDVKFFDSPSAHLIAVDKPEKEVKKAALVFAEIGKLKHIPEMEWRFFATGLRALFAFEFIMRERIRLDWISQAVCAGYGPIGFYNMSQKLVQEGVIGKKQVPRFLGIQQEALSPMVRAWQKRHRQIQSEDIVPVSRELLDPTLYNTNPDGSYPILYKHLLDFGGELCPLRNEEYERYLPLLRSELAAADIQVTTRQRNGKEEILENAGLINLSGTLRAIDDGIMKKGETVLSFFTGGARGHSGREAVPEYRIKREDDLESAVRNYVRTLQGTPRPDVMSRT